MGSDEKGCREAMKQKQMSKVHQRNSRVTRPRSKARAEQELESEIERAALVQRLLESSTLEKTTAPVHKQEVFTVSEPDGQAMTGCSSGDEREFMQWALTSTHNVLAQKADELNGGKAWLLKAQRAALMALKPKSPLEAMLIQQSLITHELATSFARRAIATEDSNLASKFASQFTRLATLACDQALSIQRLRGELSQQQISVQHLNVESGARAIVGSVHAGTPGENNNNADQTP